MAYNKLNDMFGTLRNSRAYGIEKPICYKFISTFKYLVDLRSLNSQRLETLASTVHNATLISEKIPSCKGGLLAIFGGA